MSNYQKYYQVNMSRTNPNKCLMRVPINTGRYGWSSSFTDILFNYFTQLWFTETGISENMLYKYVSSVIDRAPFDFDGYKYVGNNLYDHPFKSIKAAHEACTVNIYAERIYTNFYSYALNYHGKHLSLLATLIRHPEFVKALEYTGKQKYYGRIYNMDQDTAFKFTSFAKLVEKAEKPTKEQTKIIIDGFDHFINYVQTQTLYTPDELKSSYKSKSFTALIFSLYLEFFIFINDANRINQLFEVYHKIGNIKAKNFHKYLKNKEDNENFAERPMSKYVESSVLSQSKISLDEFYYYISFYKQYENGKFLKKIVSEDLLQKYVMAFKAATALKQSVPKEYYTLFNELKGDDIYSLETFEQMNMLVANELEGPKALDILEQNFTMLELCLNTDVYGSRWSSDIYNLFTHICYDKLNESQQARYWKMVANFVNNTKFKSNRIKKILNDITRLLEITPGDIITKLQPHVINIKQPILLELYFE